MATWKPIEQYAPFAQILVRYMWESRPPLNPNQLAIRSGVRRQVLSQWLNAPASAELHPDPAAVVKIARAMGVPVADLLIVAGHATESDPLLDRPGAWAYILQRIEASPPFAATAEQEGSQQGEIWDESTRHRIMESLRSLATADIAAHRSSVASALSMESPPHDAHNEQPQDSPADAPDASAVDSAGTADANEVPSAS